MPLILVACGADLVISGPSPPLAPVAWTARESVCILQPQDARFGQTVYLGSGKQVADRIAHVLLREHPAVVIRIETQDRPLAVCAAQHGAYAIIPVIQRWELHENALIFREDVRVQLAVARPPRPDPLRTVTFQKKDSRLNVLTPYHELPPAEFDDAVLRLLTPD